LVIGHTLTDTIIQNRFSGVAFTVATLTLLKELAVEKYRGTFHLKIDTGMHRQGIMFEELSEAMDLIEHRGLSVEGLCSHLADSDGGDPTFTQEQIKKWNEIVRMWKTRFPQTTWYHLSATSGIRYANTIDANLYRLGLGVYGFESAGMVEGLRPALSLHTRITAIRHIDAGEKVGYNGTFIAQRPTTIATIPVGYYEGLDRRLSNKGTVRIRGKEYPIVGRISMNMTTVDTTDLPDVQEDESVEVIGTDLGANNNVQAIARLCTTIPYEILIHIAAHLRREVV
jgi:alanine racemase